MTLASGLKSEIAPIAAKWAARLSQEKTPTLSAGKYQSGSHSMHSGKESNETKLKQAWYL